MEEGIPPPLPQRKKAANICCQCAYIIGVIIKIIIILLFILLFALWLWSFTTKSNIWPEVAKALPNATTDDHPSSLWSEVILMSFKEPFTSDDELSDDVISWLAKNQPTYQQTGGPLTKKLVAECFMRSHMIVCDLTQKRTFVCRCGY